MVIYYPSYIFIRNKYFRWYRSICERANERNKNIIEYTENHHILPSCIFPEFSNLTNNTWNGAKLTFREHFIAHWLLSKCMVQIKHQMQMSKAIVYMCGFKNENCIVSSYQYEIVKRIASDATVLQWQDPEYSEMMKQIHNSPETKENHSNAAFLMWQNEEYRNKQSKREYLNDPDFKQRKSKSAKDAANTPEERKRRKQSAIDRWSNPKFIEENTFYCDCCDKSIVGVSNWNRHLKSKRHYQSSS